MNWLALQTTLDVMNGIACVLMGLVLIGLLILYLHRDPPWDIDEKGPWS